MSNAPVRQLLPQRRQEQALGGDDAEPGITGLKVFEADVVLVPIDADRTTERSAHPFDNCEVSAFSGAKAAFVPP